MKSKKHAEVIHLIKTVNSVVDSKTPTREGLSNLFTGKSDQQMVMLLDAHPENRLAVFRSIAHDRRAAIIDLINKHTLRSLVGHLTDNELAHFIEESPTIISQKIIHTVERSRLERLLPLVLDESRRLKLQSFANYPKRSVGRIVQAELVVVPSNANVGNALDEVAKSDLSARPMYQVYVTDSTDNFVGVVPLFDLVREPKTKPLKQLLIAKPPIISPLTSQQKAAQLFQEYDLIEAPVIQKGALVGRVLVDDILDVIQQEFTEDIQKFAGITSEETMETSVVQSSRRRLPWMIGNIFLDLIAVSVILPFEATIAEVTALAVLMPIVSDMGGNVGIQSLSVSVRALASNRPDWKLVSRELVKEARVGILNGTILGAIIGVIAFTLWGNPFLGVIVAAALFVNTIVASIVGGVLPIILRRLNKDPAMMSGAVLTTITDFFGFLIFLGLARVFLEQLL